MFTSSYLEARVYTFVVADLIYHNGFVTLDSDLLYIGKVLLNIVIEPDTQVVNTEAQ